MRLQSVYRCECMITGADAVTGSLINKFFQSSVAAPSEILTFYKIKNWPKFSDSWYSELKKKWNYQSELLHMYKVLCANLMNNEHKAELHPSM